VLGFRGHASTSWDDSRAHHYSDTPD
jgi:hypothetical protein